MPARPTDELRVCVWRGDAGGGAFVRYRAPRLPNQTVLDVVTWIQRNAEPGLSYRFACRVGMCGSCAMMVNGKPRWTCRTHVQEVLGARRGKARRLELAPLRNLPVIKDLVCDLSEFFDKWQRAEGRFHAASAAPEPGNREERHNGRHDGQHRGRHHEIAVLPPHTPHRAAADAAIECINCAVCYAACDVVGWNPDYLGPAALNRAWSLLNDDRDHSQTRRLRAVSAAGGCQNCHSQQGCASHCPVQLSPARSIAGLKRALAGAVLKGRGRGLW